MTKNEIRKKDHKQKNEWGYIIPCRPSGSYMIESRVKKLFKKWLKKNLDRFNYKPYPKNSVCNEYYFEGIAKNITLVMDYRSPEAMIYHVNPQDPNRCCDHDVVEYIGYEKYDPQKGYYDSDRVDEKYTYFPTQEELYIHEVFEKIITYVNENFVKGNSLYIHQSSNSSSSKIAPKTEAEALKENFGGTSMCLRLSGTPSENEVDEPVMYVYDLFREVE